MKFFHLSDLHIGLKLQNRDLQEDQEEIFQQIVEAAGREKPDAVVIAGDIYDRAVPSAEAVGVFDHFIAELTAAVPGASVMMISGNHDSAPRVNCFRSVLSRQKLYMVGLPPQTEEEQIERVTLSDEFGRVNFYLLPFVRPSAVRHIVGGSGDGGSLSYDETVRRLLAREKIDQKERNVLVSHQFYVPAGKRAEEIERMDSEVRTVGNIDEVKADVLDAFDYAALGHIHKPMQVGCERFRYCGTPLACSVSEAGQQKAILQVELTAKGVPARITALPLEPLRAVRVIRGSLEEVLRCACSDYVTVVLTDSRIADVAGMQERLHLAFPYLLEVRRETVHSAGGAGAAERGRDTLDDPFGLCCTFLPDLDEGEKDLLRDVIHEVCAGGERKQ